MSLPSPQISAWCLRITVHSLLQPPLHQVTKPCTIYSWNVSDNNFSYSILTAPLTLWIFIPHLHLCLTWSFLLSFCSLQFLLPPTTIFTLLKVDFNWGAYLFNNLHQFTFTHQIEFWHLRPNIIWPAKPSPTSFLTSFHIQHGGGRAWLQSQIPLSRAMALGKLSEPLLPHP